MNITSSNQILTENDRKVKRWRTIQTQVLKMQSIQRQDSNVDTLLKNETTSQKSKLSIFQLNNDLNNVQQQQPQPPQDKRLSLFSHFQRQYTVQNKQEGKIVSAVKALRQGLKSRIQSHENTIRLAETNLTSPNCDVINQLNNQGWDSPKNFNIEQSDENQLQQKEDPSELEESEDNEDIEGVYFKDFESMQGDFQIYAQVDQIFKQEFLALVNDPTYDPSEKLGNEEEEISKKKFNFSDCMKQTIKIKSICSCSKAELSNIQIQQYQSQTSIMKEEEKKKKKIFDPKERKYRFIISPDSPFRISWDILCMFMIVYAIIMVPFRMAFDPDDQFESLVQTEQIFDYIFMVDILINFNTAVYINGVLVKDRRAIIREYLKIWFWLDFFSSFPYDMVVTAAINQQQDVAQDQDTANNGQQQTKSSSSLSGIQNAQKIIRMLKFFRLMKVLKLLRVAKLKIIIEKLAEYLKLSQSVLGVLGFLKLSSIVLIIAHWIACMWFLVGTQNTTESWIIEIGMQNENWDIKYITSIYWAITTMVTVGYGDITPKNREEKIFTIFIMLLACGIFAYTMNTMGTVLSQIESFSSEYKKEIQSVNRYLDNKKVKLELRIRIRKYLEYIYDSKQKNQIDETNLLSKLSSSLKNDLIHQINVKVINNCYLLTEIFDKTNRTQFLFQISISLQEKITIPEEIIIEQDDDNIEDDKSMYFIQDGEVEIFFQHSNRKTILKRLGAGSYFGELSFFTDLKRSASVQSVNFASLYYLKRSDFLKILQKFPNQRLIIYLHKKENFFEIGDKIKNYKNYDALQLTCFSCQQKGHIASNCTNLSFSFFKSRYIEKLLQNYENDEINLTRNTREKFETFKSRKKLENCQEKIQQTPLVLSYIRFYNIDREISGESKDIQILNKTNGNYLVDTVKQGKLNQNIHSVSQKKQKRKHNQGQGSHNNEYFLQMQYWKQVEEFDKVKIYERYFKHNNVPQGDGEDDHLFQPDLEKSQINRPSISNLVPQDLKHKIAPLINSRRKFQNDNGFNSPKVNNTNVQQNGANKELEDLQESSSSSQSSTSSKSSKQSKQSKAVLSIKIVSKKSIQRKENNCVESVNNNEIDSQNNIFTNQQSQKGDDEVDTHKFFEIINSQFNENMVCEDFNLDQISSTFNYGISPPTIINQQQYGMSQFKNMQNSNQNDKQDNEKEEEEKNQN